MVDSTCVLRGPSSIRGRDVTNQSRRLTARFARSFELFKSRASSGSVFVVAALRYYISSRTHTSYYRKCTFVHVRIIEILTEAQNLNAAQLRFAVYYS